MNDTDPRSQLDERIDAIESGYEFCLAYAAQGRQSDREPGSGPGELRDRLAGMAQALDGLGPVVRRCAADLDAAWLDTGAAFFQALEDDTAKAAGALRLVMAQSAISSQLIDNLNASIHLRALLTDLFLADEAFRDQSA